MLVVINKFSCSNDTTGPRPSTGRTEKNGIFPSLFCIHYSRFSLASPIANIQCSKNAERFRERKIEVERMNEK